MTKTSSIWYKYVTIWSNNVRIRVYPASSLGHAMREAQSIIESDSFSYYHEIMVCPLDILEDTGECKNFLRREDVLMWFRAARPMFKEPGTYTPPKDQRREHRGLSPHPYPPFLPSLEPDVETYRLSRQPSNGDTPIVQNILDDHEKRRQSLDEKFLNYGIETWHIKVSRDEEVPEAKA